MVRSVRDKMTASTSSTGRGFLLRLPRSSVTVLASTLLLTLAGCGGSTPEPAAPTMAEPAPQSRPIGFPQRVQEKQPEGVDLSGVDPDDVFALASAPPPNFTATGRSTAAPPEDQFVASIDPAAGSSQFIVVDQPASEEATSQTPAGIPAGFVSVADAELIDGLPSRIRCEADQSEMVLVPAGESLLGTAKGPDSCVPEVPVSLSAFYISVVEVNVAQFSEFRSRSIRAGNVIEKPLNVDGPLDHPALGVSWMEAREYARSTGRDLPTECQWEKAARGPSGLTAPWGNSRPLWRVPREIGQIDVCGSHPDDRSVYGVMDMAGNAREWMVDFFSDRNHQDLAEMDSSRRRDWPGPRRASNTGERVVKGDGPEWAVWFRRGQRMTERNPATGFRCVLNLSPTQ